MSAGNRAGLRVSLEAEEAVWLLTSEHGRIPGLNAATLGSCGVDSDGHKTKFCDSPVSMETEEDYNNNLDL